MDWLAKLVSRKTPSMDAFYAKRRAETEENNRLVRLFVSKPPLPLPAPPNS